jgi:hypothetical protein
MATLDSKQEEWSSLLISETPDAYVPPTEAMLGSLGPQDRKRLAAYWLSDGLHARHIDFPQSSDELTYYK